MPLIASAHHQPRIDPSAHVASTAVISGDVHIGPHTVVAHGAIIVAEGGPVRVGESCVVMETAVLRGVPGQCLRLGRHVMVGPRAHLVGCEIEDEVFLATGATVFNGAQIGARSEVRINGLVHLRTRLPADSMVPIGWVAVGDPAQILPPDRHEEIWAIQQALAFPKYVFKLGPLAPGQSPMAAMMGRYAKALQRLHASDRVLG